MSACADQCPICKTALADQCCETCGSLEGVDEDSFATSRVFGYDWAAGSVAPWRDASGNAYATPAELAEVALAAAGLVHDLGKALLPRDLLEMQFLNASQYRWLQGHVALITQRLESCRWLASSVVEAVVRDVNERLDGHGYPHGRGADELP